MSQYRSLPRNARVCIALEPLWSLFGPIVVYYAPLYQRALGLNEVQMGIVNSVNIAAGFVFFALASPLANRLGRRKTSILFDLIAWSAAMLVWAFARNFIWFLVAGILNAVVKIVIVSWNLLITEDAEEDQRATIHGWMYLIGSAAGLITFIGGLVIERKGLVPSMRVLYFAGSITMTVMFVVRFALTRETATGLVLMEKSKAIPFTKAVAAQVHDSGSALKDRRFQKLFGIFFIANAVQCIDFYRILYLQETKALEPEIVAFIPAFGAVLSIVMFFFVMPRLPKSRDPGILAWSFLVCALSQASLILIPQRSAALAIVAAGGLQTSYFMVQAFRDAVFMNSADEKRRGELFSLVQALTMLASIPLGWLSGLLYSLNSALPFIATCALCLLGFILARGLRATGEAKL